MAGIPERSYNAACGRLATRLGISQSAARRKVEVRSAQEGMRDTASRQAIAERMLDEANAAGVDNGAFLTAQLEAVGNDVNFMLED